VSLRASLIILLLPLFAAAAESSVGRPVLTLFHGFAFILATIPVRAFVGEATKLPPQYFDVTVGDCNGVLLSGHVAVDFCNVSFDYRFYFYDG